MNPPPPSGLLRNSANLGLELLLKKLSYLLTRARLAVSFLVVSTRLYNLLYPSIGWSVTFYFFYDFIDPTAPAQMV